MPEIEETTRQVLARAQIDSHWLREGSAPQRLLFAYAHPDDESFGSAGTILRYTRAGAEVHYVCATRGECGDVDPALLNGSSDIAALRSAELLCAAQTLELSGVHFLGHRDSGMAGSVENQHAQAFCAVPLDQVTRQLVALIRAVRPQVLVTFNAYGGYGHPDHIQIHRAARAAFFAAADPEQFPQTGPAWQTQKLYYTTFGGLFIRLALRLMPFFGTDPERFGRNNDVDLLRVAQEITPTTTRIDARQFADSIIQSWECHRSQLGGMGPRPLRRFFVGQERLSRAQPLWQPGEPLERDLFAGIA